MILILGSARSGTTFLAKLFDSHPEALYLHEPDQFVPKKEFMRHDATQEHDAFLAKEYLNALLAVRTPKTTTQLPFFPKSYRSPLKQKCFELSAKFFKYCSYAPIPHIEKKLTVPYLFDKEFLDKSFPVIKCVISLPYAKKFAESDNNIKIIHIIRNPCGVIASQLRGIQSGKMSKRIFFDSVLKNYKEYYRHHFFLEDIQKFSYTEKSAFKWMVRNEKVYQEMNGNKQYKIIRYEDLCNDTMSFTKELFSFCNIFYSSQTEKFINNLCNSNQQDSSYFSVMKSPVKIYDKWREHMSQDTINTILRIIQKSSIGKYYSQ